MLNPSWFGVDLAELDVLGSEHAKLLVNEKHRSASSALIDCEDQIWGFWFCHTDSIFSQERIKMKGYFQPRKFYLFPKTLLNFFRRYLRLEVEGLENVPERGHAIVLPNHSGWSGYDAVMIGNEILRATQRLPRILAHRAFFRIRDLKPLSRKMGLREASLRTALRLLRHGNMIVLFPEGEHGNFKPTSQRYQLQDFKRGFVRLALLTGAPIIPTIVIGAEESFINLASVRLKKALKILPIPLNFFPLPAKWKIRFLEPIRLEGYSASDVQNTELVHAIAREVQQRMQSAIYEELSKRKWIYFPPPEPKPQLGHRSAA